MNPSISDNNSRKQRQIRMYVLEENMSFIISLMFVLDLFHSRASGQC